MNINNGRSPQLPMGLPHDRQAFARPPFAQQSLERSWQIKHRRRWGQQLKTWGAQVVAMLSQGQEPRIARVVTSSGPQWKVYDPVGDRIHWFHQEQEVRVWLEQRYSLK